MTAQLIGYYGDYIAGTLTGKLVYGKQVQYREGDLLLQVAI